MLVGVKKRYLINIIAAENTGTALSLDYCNQWGSSWDSIVGCGQVYRCRVNGVTITESGKCWLREHYPEVDLDKIKPYNSEIAKKEGHPSFDMIWKPVVVLILAMIGWCIVIGLWQVITNKGG